MREPPRGLLTLQGAVKTYRRVEGARLANDNGPDLAAVACAGKVAEGALHLGEQAHAGGAAVFKQSSAAFRLDCQRMMRRGRCSNL